MTWNRPCREDLDAWEELGNAGWGWDGMLPFFRKSESFRPPDSDRKDKYHQHFDAEYHGTNGSLQTAYGVDYGASHAYWHDTLNNLGVKTNQSHMSGSNVGVWTAVTSVDAETRLRSYSASAYYKPNASRRNLVVLTEATVQDIVLDKSDGSDWVASGVRFVHDGQEHVVKTEGEIIICCGSVQSPQLLELSGIGDPSVLKSAGIDVKIANSNVGENLQDHMMTAMVYEADPSIITPEDFRADPQLAEAADKEFAVSRSGPRTAIPSSIAYLPFAYYLPKTELAALISEELQSTSNGVERRRDSILAKRFTGDGNLGQIEFCFDVSNYSPHFTSVPGKKYCTMLMMLQYPFSKGSIHISAVQEGRKPSTDDKPVIDPQYYGGPGGQIDYTMMHSAQKFAVKICETEPMGSFLKKRVWPPAETTEFSDFVRNYTITDWHPVGTCAMGGKEGKNGGVVDERLRVYGIKNLRVCDASIMPLHISSHPQATIYAIGEKGASLILEDWAQRQ